jgi:hypothetical protein
MAVKEKATLSEMEKRLHDCQLEKQELLSSRYIFILLIMPGF